MTPRAFLGWLIRRPLALLPKEAVVPVMSGPLRGARWIVGSATHGCWLGTYERRKQRVLESILKPGQVFWDVGANVGFYSLLGSRLVGDGGEVVALEPLPRNVEYLERHCELNPWARVRVLPYAATAADGLVRFTDFESSSQNRVSERGALEVEGRSLDSLVENDELPVPDVVKMDIEGGELQALRGMARLVASRTPTLLVATHGTSNHDALVGLLEHHDYSVEIYEDSAGTGHREILARAPGRDDRAKTGLDADTEDSSSLVVEAGISTPSDRSQLPIGKRVFFTVVAFLLLLVLPLALAESGMRLYIWSKHGVPGKTYGLWRGDRELGAVHRENAYNTQTQTNDFGFRNRENVLEPKPEGAWRIITYGGSTTFCYNLADEDTWPRQLERLLREGHHPSDQVLNGGAILWSLGHAYARAKRDLPRLRPDFVILYSGINEETNAAFLERQGRLLSETLMRGEHGAFATNLDQNRWSKRNLVLVRFLDYKVKARLERRRKPTASTELMGATEETVPDPIVLENYTRILRDFIHLVRANGGVPVFVVQAHSQSSARNERLTAYSRSGGAVARALGVQVVDAEEVVARHQGDPMELFSASGVHWSTIGAARLAEILYESALSSAESGPGFPADETSSLRAAR